MSTPNLPPAGSTIPEIIPPRCPHCRELIPQINGYPYTLSSFAILCIYCPHAETCGKVIHFQIFQAPGEQRIVEPS